MSFINIITSSVRLCTQKLLPATIVTRSFHGLMMKAPSTTIVATNPIRQETNNFLAPVTSLISQVAGFKVKGRLKKRCKDCYFVMRQERLFIICPTHPRHKQMAMKAKPRKSWVLTHATQSKVRPY